jgi:hypothetical protein
VLDIRAKIDPAPSHNFPGSAVRLRCPPPTDGAVPIISVDLDTLASKGRVSIDAPIPMATDLTLTASADTAQIIATFEACPGRRLTRLNGHA